MTPAQLAPRAPSDKRALAGRTIVMSGGSRGIGLAIATQAARHGANAVILAKTDKPHPKLPGTIHTAVAQIEAAAAECGSGARAVAVVGDVRNEADVERAAAAAVEAFGGIDIVINNASAISKAGTLEVSLKQFDLMQAINVRGTFALTRACLPHLVKSPHAHILTMSPPLNMAPRWLAPFGAYTQTKYGMTLLTLGWAAEFAGRGVAANCLWPQTRIGTAVTVNLMGGEAALATARTPQIMADAAVELLARPPAQAGTGQALIDADVLAGIGVTDFAARYGGGDAPVLDLYIDPPDGTEPAILAR